MSGLVKTLEKWVVPTRLQQLYKGYFLEDVTLDQIGMPLDFLILLAQLADMIYLTGTYRWHSKVGSEHDQSVRTALGGLIGKDFPVQRFDAATGAAFETMGPFGAVACSAVPPGQERVPPTGRVHPDQPRYRVFLIFRGTKPGLLYWDDISTDAKAATFNIDNPLGQRAGTLARGFLNTYLSCRNEVIGRLLPQALESLRSRHRKYAAEFLKERPGETAPGLKATLPDDRIEVYVVGHSLGGAVATLCAYDIACAIPRLNPVLVTFGSPPVGNIDFAIDFESRFVTGPARLHPYSGYLRSVRVVALAQDDTQDAVAVLPDKLPNLIHVNSRLVLPSVAKNRWGAHSLQTSYISGLEAQQGGK
jgi:hypothetical protein